MTTKRLRSRALSRRRGYQRQFISFFSGALGLDLGLEAAGLHCLAVNDADSVACSTIRRNRPDLRIYDRDVRNISQSVLSSDLGVEPGELFAIVGGPPCPGFLHRRSKARS